MMPCMRLRMVWYSSVSGRDVAIVVVVGVVLDVVVVVVDLNGVVDVVGAVAVLDCISI